MEFTTKLADTLKNHFNINPALLVPTKWARMLYGCDVIYAAT